jgi:hypothetical protein
MADSIATDILSAVTIHCKTGNRVRQTAAGLTGREARPRWTHERIRPLTLNLKPGKGASRQTDNTGDQETYARALGNSRSIFP